MRWVGFRVFCSLQASEAVVAILHDIASGVSVTDTPEGVVYCAYVRQGPEAERAAAVLQTRLQDLPAELLEHGTPTVSRSWVEEEDWAEAWKTYYQPLRIGRRLVVKPTWRLWPPPDDPVAARRDDIVIELDPGMAFGTGSHVTTQLCLEALEEVVRPGMRLVDLGCGSGILAIAALKLGAECVLAVDSDPAAIEIARANCQRNGVAERCETRDQAGLADLEGRWDVIVANISAPIIKQQVPGAARLLAPGGTLICSGFYVGYEAEVGELLEAHGFGLVHGREQDMWCCLIGQRK